MLPALTRGRAQGSPRKLARSLRKSRLQCPTLATSMAVCRWTVNRLSVDLVSTAGGNPAAL